MGAGASAHDGDVDGDSAAAGATAPEADVDPDLQRLVGKIVSSHEKVDGCGRRRSLRATA